MPGWTIEMVLDVAQAQARTAYQRHILDGSESVSGSSLRGLARQYASSYMRTRRALFQRIEYALRRTGWEVHDVRLTSAHHGRRVWAYLSPTGQVHYLDGRLMSRADIVDMPQPGPVGELRRAVV